MTRKKQEVVSSKPSKSSCIKAEGSGKSSPRGVAARHAKKLAEDFLARLNRSCEQRGSELLDRLYAERPELYFIALVKLAILDAEPSRLNDFDLRHNRDEVLRRLGKQV
jgi:hypothetical protein